MANKRVCKSDRIATPTHKASKQSQTAVGPGGTEKIPAEAIERLRKSLAQFNTENREAGQAVGRNYVHRAEAGQLERLRMFREGLDSFAWDSLFDDEDGDPACDIFKAMSPPDDPRDFDEFWECVIGDDVSSLRHPEFVRGFAESVLDTWNEVKRQL